MLCSSCGEGAVGPHCLNSARVSRPSGAGRGPTQSAGPRAGLLTPAPRGSPKPTLGISQGHSLHLLPPFLSLGIELSHFHGESMYENEVCSPFGMS